MTREPFRLKRPEPDGLENKQPVIKLKPGYYQAIARWKAKTGLPMGNIVEQCIDYAFANMEEAEEDAR